MPELLISSFGRRGGIYRFSPDTGELRRILRGASYGLCQLPDGRFARARARTGIVDVFDLSGRRPEKHHLWNPEGHYHDLVPYAGGVYAVSSTATSIEIYDSSWSLAHSFSPDAESSLYWDPWHVTSLVVESDALLLAAFAISRDDEGWRQPPCKGVVLDLLRQGVVLGGLNCPHTLRRLPAGVAVCDSVHPALVILGEDGTSTRYPFTGGFLRGLAPVPDGVFAGVSSLRRRRPAPALVAYLDNDFKVQEQWPMPFPEIYDILALGGSS